MTDLQQTMGSEPTLQTGPGGEARSRLAAGAGAEEPSLNFFRVLPVAPSLPGGPGGVSIPRLAPVPKLGRLVTHEGAAADRLELPAAEICSPLSGFQQQQPAGGCLLPPSLLQLSLLLIHHCSAPPPTFLSFLVSISFSMGLFCSLIFGRPSCLNLFHLKAFMSFLPLASSVHR